MPEIEKEAPMTLPRTQVEQILAGIWAEVLNLPHVGIHDNFIALGGNSLVAIQILFEASQAGLEFSPTQFFDCLTIAELAQVVVVGPDSLEREQASGTGEVPLTPMQKIFLYGNERDHHQFNISFFFDTTTPAPLDPQVLATALRAVMRHHDATRLRFTYNAPHWYQHIAEGEVEVPLTIVDLSAMSYELQQQAMNQTATATQSSLNLTAGPMLRIVLFQRGPLQPDRLLITMHHLITDGFAFGILLEDLQTAYQQLVNGETIRLPGRGTTFKEWAERLKAYATDDLLERQFQYWMDLPWRHLVPLPKDFPEGREAGKASGSVRGGVTADVTKMLFQHVPHTGITSDFVMIAALVRTVACWTEGQPILLETVESGRTPRFDDINLSRTVGWVANNPLFFFDIGTVDQPGEVLRAVHSQLQQMPSRQIGYFGLLCYLEEPEKVEKVRNAPPAQVFFNFVSRLVRFSPETSFLAPVIEAIDDTETTATRDYKTKRIELIAMMTEDTLTWQWEYNPRFYQRATILHLNTLYEQNLQRLIDHCLTATG